MNFDQQIYEANIPTPCKLRTWKDHAEILMLCWGYCRHLRDYMDDMLIPEYECGKECEFHKEHDPELLRKILSKGEDAQ